MLNYIKILGKNFFLIINLFFIVVRFSISQEEEFKSRLLINKLPDEKKIYKNKQLDSNIPQNNSKSKDKKKTTGAQEKKKKVVKPKLDNEIKVKPNRFKIFYKPNEVSPINKDLNRILNNFVADNKKIKINIVSYASKTVDKTSSDARRLSLSRALLLRKIFIDNKFLSTNIYVRAMGSNNTTEESQDVVIIETN